MTRWIKINKVDKMEKTYLEILVLRIIGLRVDNIYWIKQATNGSADKNDHRNLSSEGNDERGLPPKWDEN